MAEFSKFNGYDVKDKSARNQIATINTTIQELNRIIGELDVLVNNITETTSTQGTLIGELTEDLSKITVPTKVSDLENDSGFISEVPMITVEKGGTGATDPFNAMMNLGIRGCCASGVSGSSTTLPDGEITKIPLTRFITQMQKMDPDNNMYPFEITEAGGVRVNFTGYYLIGGGAYISLPANEGVEMGRGVYITDQDGNEILSSADRVYSGGSTCGFGTSMKLVYLTDGDVLYLNARAMNVIGTVYNGNVTTFLSVIGFQD